MTSFSRSATLCLALLAPAGALAQEAAPSSQAEAPPAQSATPAGAEQDDDPDYDDGMPRFRVELGITGYPFINNKMKAGQEGVATSFEPFVDTGMPHRLTYGVAAYVDVKLWEWASLGGMYWAYKTSGPKRHIEEDIGLDTTFFPEGTQLRATVEMQHAELTLRYVWFHTDRIHLWFGIGASWFSQRVALRPPSGAGASDRIEAAFAPALTYSLAGNLPGSKLKIHLSGAVAVSYSQWPSVITWSRLGVRYEVVEGFELTCSLHSRNGFISKEKGVTRYDVTSGYRHQRTRWDVIGLEIGFAFAL